eukprot:scaffold137351_cov35-Tisochrysis_lutea.AAC.3
MESQVRVTDTGGRRGRRCAHGMEAASRMYLDGITSPYDGHRIRDFMILLPRTRPWTQYF